MTHGVTPGEGFGSPLAAGETPAPEHCDHDRTFTRIDRLGPMRDVSIVSVGRGGRRHVETEARAAVLEKTIICSDCRAELQKIFPGKETHGPV